MQSVAQFDHQLTDDALTFHDALLAQRWQAGMQEHGAQSYSDDKTQVPPGQRITDWCLAWRVCDGGLVLVHLLYGDRIAIYPSGLPYQTCYVCRTVDEPLYWGPWCDATGQVVAA